jgi:PPOX class probable F420-dependent enzyme
MSAQLSSGVLKLFSEPNIGHVATVMPNGAPQVTPVWVDTDGAHVIFNTAEGRQKTRNLQRNSKVAVSITDRANPYSYVTVRGHVVEVTRQGADDHIDKMAKKYINQDRYPYRRPGEQRIIVKILPEKVTGQGTE